MQKKLLIVFALYSSLLLCPTGPEERAAGAGDENQTPAHLDIGLTNDVPPTPFNTPVFTTPIKKRRLGAGEPPGAPIGNRRLPLRFEDEPLDATVVRRLDYEY